MTRVAVAAIALIVIITLARVAATHHVFSPTYDEPAHIAGGYEYLRAHRYTFDTQHPPLARILFAMPFRGSRTVAVDDKWIGDIIASAGGYMNGIAAARRGNLLFVALAIVGVALWAWQLYGAVAAPIASALFATLPPVLAHGGLATTDMAGAAAFALAMAAVWWWLDRPTWRRTILLGLAIGFGLVTKMSFPLFFAIGAITMCVVKRRLPVVKAIAAHVLGLLIVFAVYRGHIETMASIDDDARTMATELLGSPRIAEVRMPMPEFFNGLMVLELHNRHGHESYFMGEIRDTGWWYYFPVLLAIKTPIPFLILAIIGAFQTRHRYLIVIALLMLASAMTSHINLGIRHLLPIYAPLSILATIALLPTGEGAAKRRMRGVSIALCVWFLIDSALARPDYLPWMNAFAGKHPERVVLDSNFDWGQDVERLHREVAKQHIPELHTALFGTVDYKRIGLPDTVDIDPFRAAPGWYAISESIVIPAQVRDRTAYFWLTSGYRFQRIGKTIRLYHVP